MLATCSVTRSRQLERNDSSPPPLLPHLGEHVVDADCALTVGLRHAVQPSHLLQTQTGGGGVLRGCWTPAAAPYSRRAAVRSATLALASTALGSQQTAIS